MRSLLSRSLSVYNDMSTTDNYFKYPQPATLFALKLIAT